MRRAALVLTTLVGAAVGATAQQPMPPQQPQQLQTVGGFGGQTQTQTQPAGGALPVAQSAPVQPAVDAATLQHLAGWEAAMKAVKTFYVQASKVYKDVPKKHETAFTVDLWLLKPNLARMDEVRVVPKGQQPTAADKKYYVSDGRKIYEYDFGTRKRMSADLGPGGAGNNLLLDLMSGMSAKEITDRFAVRTAKVDENGFVILEVKPLLKTDKEEFESITLALCGPQYKDRAYIPRMIVFTREGGQQTETWDFPTPNVNPAGIGPQYFVPPKLEAGWTDEKKELPRAPSSAVPTGRIPPPGGGR
jgi:TIGR03009 family protein